MGFAMQVSPPDHPFGPVRDRPYRLRWKVDPDPPLGLLLRNRLVRAFQALSPEPSSNGGLCRCREFAGKGEFDPLDLAAELRTSCVEYGERLRNDLGDEGRDLGRCSSDSHRP